MLSTGSLELHCLLQAACPEPPSPFWEGKRTPSPSRCSSWNWDRGQHRPDSQKSLALHLPPAPGFVPSPITLPWFLPIAPPGLGPPSPAPRKAGAATALCHLLHHSSAQGAQQQMPFHTQSFLPEASCSEGWWCLCGGCAAWPWSGFVRARGVCVCFIPWCVPVNSVSYCGLLLYVFQWLCLFLAFLSLQIKCS